MFISLDRDSRYELKVIYGQILGNNHRNGGANGVCMQCHTPPESGIPGNEPPAIPIPPVIIPPKPRPWIPQYPSYPPIPYPIGGSTPSPAPPPPPPPPPPPSSNPSTNDPCEIAKEGVDKANELGKKELFKNALRNVLNAFQNNGNENGISFGSHTQNGNIEASSLQNFGYTSGSMQNPFAYPVADIHNHPDEMPPSPGDIYSMIRYHGQYNSFRTRYVVTPSGTVYALVVTSPSDMAEFLLNYPPQQHAGHSPRFPGQMFIEWNDMRYTLSEAGATSYILRKYNVGISLTKMDGAGRFRNINITENNTSGNSPTYNYNLCP